jgi:hypothetical protein
MMTRTKLGMTKTVLTKTTADGTAFCVFRTLKNNMVRVYSYATWTDYTVDLEVCRAEARATYARLVGEGYAVEAEGDRCNWLGHRAECCEGTTWTASAPATCEAA